MRSTKVVARKSTINCTIKFLLIVLGIWPDTLSVTFSRIFWSISLGALEVCQYRYLLTHLYSSDVFELMDCFGAFIGFVKFSFKISIFWWNQRIFNQILKMMVEDWRDCANNDNEMSKAINKAEISDCIVNAIVSLYTVAVFFYGISIILDDVDITDSSIEIPHIYKMEFPFDIKTQSTYKFVLIMELIHILVGSWGLGVLNALLLTLTLHIDGQIDILLYWLAKVMSIDGANKRRSNVLRKIIQKHQKIIYFVENIEKLYTLIALLQFATNVVMICLSGFLIITALDTPDATEKIMRSLSYYSVTNLETFIFCYAGEYLINKSKTIGYAAYDAAWYDMESRHSRILLIIILRSQKELTLTIGKLMDLSLHRFASIMNSAGSYISVLLAMQ
ncbi:PREDICTED: odorant receptor 4-like [Dinoponera quadriceps]|uniref:Odorant receptor n=1 Tax=Dinoponera quadriceps TaxID=609295 RepID=A0A6P3XNM9_DINQU|nr:PREDICTED: odorant receptor 4-like [Dinoponera quadriceps]